MGIVSIIISIVISILAFIVSVVSIYVSYLANKRYGDVAGTLITIKNQEQDAARARVTALRSLLNEVARIRKLADRNSEVVTQTGGIGMVRMPVTAFETAFVSGSPGLSVSSDLLDAVTDYLTEADTINSLIDTYLWLAPAVGAATYATSARSDAVNRVKDISNKLSDILKRLDERLKSELEAAEKQLATCE